MSFNPVEGRRGIDQERHRKLSFHITNPNEALSIDVTGLTIGKVMCMKSPFVLSQEDGTYDRVVIELGEVSLSSGQTVSLLKPGRMLAVMPRRTAYFEVEMIEPEPTGNCEGRDSAASKARLEKGDEYTLSLEMTNPDTGATDVVVTTEVLRVSLPR